MTIEWQSRVPFANTALLVTVILAAICASSAFCQAGVHMTLDEIQIRQLNDQYIEAFLKADVHWYQIHLSEDFVCIESSGNLLNKQEFLQDAAKGPDVTDYKLDQVRVRIFGDAALVQATGLFTRKDGTKGKSRYTDVYIRTGKEWKAVSAQITRLQD